jgi:gas vesicle protein
MAVAAATRRNEMAKERHAVAFVIGAAIGGAIGAVYGLLNAPRAGVETRIDLTERWHDVEERTAQEIANLETEVRDRIASEWSPQSGLGGPAHA